MKTIRKIFCLTLMALFLMPVAVWAQAPEFTKTTVHFADNFESQAEGSLNSGYVPTVGTNAALSATCEIVKEGSNKVMHQNGGRYTMGFSNGMISKDFVFEFDMKLGDNAAMGHELYGLIALTDATGNYTAFRVLPKTIDDKAVISANSIDVPLMEENYTNVWYHFKAVFHMTAANKTIDWYTAPLGEELVFRAAAPLENASNITSLGRLNIRANRNCYYDNLEVYEYFTAESLTTKINEAKEVYENAVVGVEVGNYTAAAKQKLSDAITEAEAIYDSEKDNPNPTVISEAIEDLENSIKEFYASVITKSIASLHELILTAKNAIDESIYGDKLGEYPISAKEELEKAVLSAETAYEQLQVSYELELLESASAALEQAFRIFKDSIHSASVDVYKEGFSTDALPSPWTVIYGAPLVIKETDGNYAMRFAKAESGCRALAYFSASELSGYVTLEFSYKAETKPTTVHQIMEVSDAEYSTNDYAFVLSSDGADIRLQTKGQTDSIVSGYEAGKWYNFRFEMNIPEKTFTAYVNDEAAFSGDARSFIGDDFLGLERLNSYMLADNEGSYLLDNFRIQTDVLQELQGAAEQIINSLGDVTKITSNINLPSQLSDTVKCSWASSDESVITSDGIVTRPINTDKTVNLTLTLKKSEYSIEKIIPVTVLKSFVGDEVSEDFTAELSQSGWQGAGAVVSEGGNRVLAVTGETSKGVDGDNLYPNGRLSFKFKQNQKSDVSKILSLTSGGATKFYLMSDGTDLILYDGSNTEGTKLVENYQAGQWYTIGISFNNNSKKAVLTQKGVKISEIDFSYIGASDKMDKLVLAEGLTSGATEFYVDDITLGRPVPSTVKWTLNDSDILRPTNSNLSVPYSIQATDSIGVALLTDDFDKKILKEDGSNAKGILLENGELIITPEADGGKITLCATAREGGETGRAILNIKAQEIATIEIIGADKITEKGTYTYTAKCLSEQNMVITPKDMRWSVTGDADIDAKTGELTVSERIKDDIIISVTADGVKQEKEVRVNIASSSSGGGGGGGMISGGKVPVKLPQSQAGNPTEKTGGFLDIEAVPWAREAIVEMAKNGIVKGISETEFAPALSVTRAQFVTMLVRAFDLYSEDAKADYKDILGMDWCYREIASAAKLGIVNGTSEEYFSPDTAISREDVAVLIYRTLKHLKYEMPNKVMKNFADENLWSEYAKTAIYSLAEEEIIFGRDEGRFDAKGTTTRAEAAVLIYRTLLKTKG